MAGVATGTEAGTMPVRSPGRRRRHHRLRSRKQTRLERSKLKAWGRAAVRVISREGGRFTKSVTAHAGLNRYGKPYCFLI